MGRDVGGDAAEAGLFGHRASLGDAIVGRATMKRTVLCGLVCALGAAPLLRAQLVGLPRFTPRDARVLVENTPAMLEAQKKGHCPRADLGGWTAAAAYFYVFAACVEGSGTIGHYKVDLTTGWVFGGGVYDVRIETPELEKLRRELREERKAALLDVREATCLMRRLPLLRDPRLGHLCPTLVERAIEQDESIHFKISFGCGLRPRWWQDYLVDRYTGLIYDRDSDRVEDSAELVELRSRFLAARRKPELAPHEGALLVEKAPPVLRAQAEGFCPVVFFSPAESGSAEMWFYVRPDCAKGKAAEFGEMLLVNRFTGAVRHPKTGEEYVTGELTQLRERLLLDAKLRVEHAKGSGGRLPGVSWKR